VTFDLEDVLIANAGVSKSDVVWHWQLRLRDTDCWTEFARTRHRIYTVLALPTDPWKPLSPDIHNTQLPWTEVLDVACDWAAGAQDIDSNTDSATAKVTRTVNALGDTNAAGVRKVTYRYDSSYILKVTNNFDCASFLNLVRGGEGNGPYVNCYDCATAVSSFSNILGADLWQSKMGFNFRFNHVLKIGQPEEDGGEFLRHEVAWKGDATKNDPVFDACLKLDGDSDPSSADSHFEPLLPINILFGDPIDERYRFRFEVATVGKGRCNARPGTKRRRRIGVSPLTKRILSQPELRILSEHYGFRQWTQNEDLTEHLLIWRFFLSGSEVRSWQSERVRSFNTKGHMPATSQGFWTPDKRSGVVLRVNTFECRSLRAAHAFLLDVLGESDLLNFEIQKPLLDEKVVEEAGYSETVAVGDVAFTDPEKKAALFARGNIVVAISNAGPDTLFVGDFVRQFDATLKSRPDEDEKVIESMEHFRFPAKKFHLGDRIPIEFFQAESFEQQLFYKFFAAAGDLVSQGRQVVYQPRSAGPQAVLVFGVDADQNARMQQLSIEIEN
jgi:hypothetical protein